MPTFSEIAKNRYANGQLKNSLFRIGEYFVCALVASLVGWIFFMNTTISEMKAKSAERTLLREAQISALQNRDQEFIALINKMSTELLTGVKENRDCLLRHIENNRIHRGGG